MMKSFSFSNPGTLTLPTEDPVFAAAFLTIGLSNSASSKLPARGKSEMGSILEVFSACLTWRLCPQSISEERSNVSHFLVSALDLRTIPLWLVFLSSSQATKSLEDHIETLLSCSSQAS